MYKNILRILLAVVVGAVFFVSPVKIWGETGSCTQEPCICDGTCVEVGGLSCTGPNACNATECCVQGACEPKSGGACSGGRLSCPAGTASNGSCESCTCVGCSNPPGPGGCVYPPLTEIVTACCDPVASCGRPASPREERSRCADGSPRFAAHRVETLTHLTHHYDSLSGAKGL